ncbi:MAG: PAS domain S-box protein [Thermomicrobiales bacterium]
MPGHPIDPTEPAPVSSLDEHRVPYRMLFEHNPLPMWVVDLETLGFLAVNDAALHLYGYTRDVFLGLKLTDIRPSDDVPAILAKIAEVSSQGFDEAGLWRHRKRNGELITVEVTSHALDFEGRAARLALINDVSERLRVAEERAKLLDQLEAEQAQLRAVLAQMPAGVVIAEAPSGRIILENGRAAAIGDAAVIRSEGVAEVGPVAIDAKGVAIDPTELALSRAIFNGEHTENQEIDLRRSDGQVITLRVSAAPVRGGAGEIIAGVATILDVTEEKAAALALKRSEEWFRFTLNSVEVGTWDWNFKTNVIAQSDNLMSIYGIGPARTPHGIADFLRLVHPDDREMVVKAVRQTLRHGTDYRVEFRVIDDDGAVRWMIARGQAVRNERGMATAMVGISVDVSARKQNDEALRLSELRFRTMIEQSPLSTQIFSPDGFTIETNDAWERLWDIPFERARTYNLFEDKDLQELGILDLMKRAFAGEPVTLPPFDYVPVWDRDAGVRRTIRGLVYPVKDVDDRVREVVLIQEDITDRQLAQARLALFQQIVANAKDAIAVMDTDGHYLERNDAHRELLGYSDEDLAGQTPAVHLGAETFALTLKELQETGFYRGDVASTAKDGHRVFVDLSAFAVHDERGTPVCFVSIKRDTTARLMTEQRLREETETLEVVNRVGRLVSSELDVRRLVQVVTDAATELTGAEVGAFFQNNADEKGDHFALLTTSDASLDDVVGLPDPGSTPVLDATFTGEAVIRLDDVASDPRFGQIAPYFGLPAGHPTIVSYLAVPLYSRSGSVLGSLVFSHSRPGVFTARAERIVTGLAAQAAIALDNANLFQRLEEALRARDEFLSIAAHELRTPVAGVKGFSQLILRSLDRGVLEPARLRNSVEAIERSSSRLAALTNDLLDVSRMRLGQLPLRLQTIDFPTFVGDLVGRFRHQIDERHTLVLDSVDHLVPVSIDSDRLEQVLMNLLDNAVKYAPQGGEIQVKLIATEDGIRLHVRDPGIGLPEDEIESIFEPFGRAANAAASDLPGLGLGLYISRNIITRHGGHIWAESPGEGYGSTFNIWLPVATAE